MAYPFPRLNSSPAVLQDTKTDSTPHDMAQRRRPFYTSARFFIIVITFAAIVLYIFRPFSSKASNQSDRVPFSIEAVEDYFNHYEGRQDCGIASRDLYTPPARNGKDGKPVPPYCQNRASLLDAMSGGGRHGFDAPFTPNGCHYRWYTTAEICMILSRFDALVFVGDTQLRHLYAGFNILLRENLALGGLKQWAMSDGERAACRCENQFVKSDCSKHSVESSEDVKKNDAGSGHRSPYFCDKTPHIYLPITGPLPSAHASTITNLLTTRPDSYHPIPIIHSLSLSTSLSYPAATASMNELAALADAASDTATRSVPFLWLGPVAAGHLKPPNLILSQGNNALWHFTTEMAREARARDVETLGAYNLTLQARSWDGSGYGVGVAVVQAMMVVNWLARLEST
ncbi:MAG: hypothetical protein M1833_004124 [Piccolia ochrophora]|nr:MAG: hypothetical protein M1833_004124 [Piccolia ochrophora]